MQRIFPWLTAILFLGCLALGYLVVHQRTEITRINLDWGAADKDKQKRILDLQHQIVAAKAAQDLADKQSAQLAQASSVAPKPQGAAANNRDSMRTIHISDIIKDHPEYAALFAKDMRRNVIRQYGDGLSSLNLPPDQVAKLKDLLVERQMSAMDAQQAAEAAGLERGTPAWQDAMKQASQDVEQQISALLGSDSAMTLQKLQAQVGIQSQIQYNYGPDFMDAGVSLNAEQSRGLAQALADASWAGKDLSTRPQGYNEPDPTTGLTPHDNRILEGAAQILSPAQLQILRTDQIDASKQSAIMKEYRKGAGNVMIMP